MIAQQSRPPPTLAKPESWSPTFNDFIARCLIKNPELRASATELLQVVFHMLSAESHYSAIVFANCFVQHQFITQVKDRSRQLVINLVNRYQKLMADKKNQRGDKKVFHCFYNFNHGHGHFSRVLLSNLVPLGFHRIIYHLRACLPRAHCANTRRKKCVHFSPHSQRIVFQPEDLPQRR